MKSMWGLRRVRLGVRGALGGSAGVLLAVACGQPSNLGNEFETGGAGGGDGIGVVAGEGGSAVGGAGTMAGNGGRSGEAGGGLALAGEGGGSNGGGGEGGAPDALPYPLAPTVPVPADCGCSSDEVCNAAQVCVPRCESGGACAVWRVERNVGSMLGSGEAVYFVLDPAHDDLGNPLPNDDGKESLWKGVYPQQPTRVAAMAGRFHTILATFDGKTYLERLPDVVLAVGDDGSITEHALPATTQHVAVSRDGVFTLMLDGSIQRLPLGADGKLDGGEFSEFIPAPPKVPRDWTDLIAGDRLWRLYGDSLCSFEVASPQTPGKCLSTDATYIFGVRGNRAFTSGRDADVLESNTDEQTTRTLAMSEGAVQAVLGDGFMAAWLSEDRLGPPLLVRFPTEGQAMKPIELLSPAVRDAMTGVPSFSGFSGPALSAGSVYWVHYFGDPKGADNSRYIFRAPVAR